MLIIENGIRQINAEFFYNIMGWEGGFVASFMEISINYNNATEYVRGANKTLWKLHFKKNFIGLLFILLFGLIFMLAGIQKGHNSFTSSVESYDNFTKIIINTKSFNFHFTVGLGMAFIVLFLFNLFFIFRQKKDYFLEINIKCNRLKRVNNTCTLRIDDKGVFYQDFEITIETKWSNFVGYKIYEGYLFLYTGYSLFKAYSVPMKQIENKELQELLKFVKDRFMERK